VKFGRDSQLEVIDGFAHTTDLKTITVPAGVGRIDVAAFAKSGLVSIFFEPGSQLTEIRKGAFKDSKLRTIHIPAGVVVKAGAFNSTACAHMFGPGVDISDCAKVSDVKEFDKKRNEKPKPKDASPSEEEEEKKKEWRMEQSKKDRFSDKKKEQRRENWKKKRRENMQLQKENLQEQNKQERN